MRPDEDQTTVIDLPDKFGAVHAAMGPLEGEIAWLALECCGSLPEFRPRLPAKAFDLRSPNA